MSQFALLLPELAIFFSLYFEEKHGYSKTNDQFKKEKNLAGLNVCAPAGMRTDIERYQTILQEDFKRCDYESFSKYFEGKILFFLE